MCIELLEQIFKISQVNAGKKHTSSTSGMKTSVKTSQLLKHRASALVPQTLRDMTAAILERDFQKFAELTMKVNLFRFELFNLY